MGNYIKRLLWLGLMFFVCMLSAGIVCSVLAETGVMAGRPLFLTQACVQAIVAFILSAWLSVRMFYKRPWSFMGMTAPCGWKPFAGVVLVLFMALPFLNWLIDLNASVRLPSSMSGLETYFKNLEEAATAYTDSMMATGSFGGLLTNILVMGLLTGFAEETFFRGATQRMIADSDGLIGRHAAVWITAFVFSAAHFQFYGFVPRLLLGAFFGYLLFSTGSLMPGIFAHFLNNSLVVLMTWLKGRGWKVESFDTVGVPADGAFPVTALVSLLLTILFIIYCWKYFFKHGQGDDRIS